MEKIYTYRKSFDHQFLIDNIHEIDKIEIEEKCYLTHPCSHHISIHMKSSLPNEWIKIEDFVSAENILYIYDLLNERNKEHFSYLVSESWKFGLHIKLLLDRIYQKHKEQLDEKNRVIDILREEIKEKNSEIIHLKFKDKRL